MVCLGGGEGFGFVGFWGVVGVGLCQYTRYARHDDYVCEVLVSRAIVDRLHGCELLLKRFGCSEAEMVISSIYSTCYVGNSNTLHPQG